MLRQDYTQIQLGKCKCKLVVLMALPGGHYLLMHSQLAMPVCGFIDYMCTLHSIYRVD